MKINRCIAIVVGLFIISQIHAQDTSPELDSQTAEVTDVADQSALDQSPVDSEALDSEALDHEALRTLRESLTEAVISGDVEQQIQFAHPKLVTTWQNNDVTHGFEELRTMMNEMNTGETRVFQGYTVRPEADDKTIFYGNDMAIAVGRSVPHYKIFGMEFDLENRWTATLVKEDGQWKLAAYHVSGNLLDNPVLSIARSSLYWASAISLLIGLAIGAVAMKFLRRHR